MTPLAAQLPDIPAWKLRAVAEGRMIWGTHPGAFGSAQAAAEALDLTPSTIHRIIQRAAEIVRAREERNSL